MEVTAERITSWELVAECARMTVHKGALGKEPSDEFKRSILLSEHSPIRVLMYKVTIKDVPYCNSVHLTRHFIGVNFFVASQRDDRFPDETPRGKKPQDAPVSMIMVGNAQALINISKKRLCNKADKVTIEVMEMVKKAICGIDPVMEYAMQPECVTRGGRCPEARTCGWCYTKKCQEEVEKVWGNSNWQTIKNELK